MMSAKHPSSQLSVNAERIWQTMQTEARKAGAEQPLMADFLHHNILQHDDFCSAISCYLSTVLALETVSAITLQELFYKAMVADSGIVECMLQDLLAHYIRDAACEQYITPFLYFKGYHAIQAYRIAHYLWQQKHHLLALYIQSRSAALFDVDIHPAAKIAGGLMVDHATGVVIGETAIIEKNVSMLHAVTLGGSGTVGGRRHPIIAEGVLLSVGAKVLGNIEIGAGVKVGAGSVVVSSVPAHATVVGVPATVIGQTNSEMPALDMDHHLDQ